MQFQKDDRKRRVTVRFEENKGCHRNLHSASVENDDQESGTKFRRPCVQDSRLGEWEQKKEVFKSMSFLPSRDYFIQDPTPRRPFLSKQSLQFRDVLMSAANTNMLATW